MYSYIELKEFTEQRIAAVTDAFGNCFDFPEFPEITPENIYRILAVTVLLEENGREKQQTLLIGGNPQRCRAFSNLPKTVCYQHLSRFGNAAACLKRLPSPGNGRELKALLSHPIIVEAAQQIKNKQNSEKFAEILTNMMAVPLAETMAYREFPDLDLSSAVEHNPLMTIAVCSNHRQIRSLAQDHDFETLLHFGQKLAANLPEICHHPEIDRYISLINTMEPIRYEFNQGGVCRLLEFTITNTGYKLPSRQDDCSFRLAHKNLIDDFYSEKEKNRIPCLNHNDPKVETALSVLVAHYPDIMAEDGAVRFVCDHAQPVIRGLGYRCCPRDNRLIAPEKLPALNGLNDLIRRSYPERYPDTQLFSLLLKRTRYGRI